MTVDFSDLKDCRLAGLMELMFLAVRDSAYLNTSQKRIVEQKLYDIVEVVESRNYIA